MRRSRSLSSSAHRPARWTNPPGVAGLLRHLGLYLGTDLATGESAFLALKFLATHIHITGPPGVGKSRFLLWLFQLLCRIRNATVVVLSPKGSFGAECRDWALTHGYSSRVVWFCPGEERVLGWNPLRPNALPVATHAKAVREGIRAAWGQSNFDQTAQLARFLYLGLAAARELKLTIVEAFRLLVPGSPLRQILLPRLRDPHLKEALEYLDSRQDRRQEELVASTVARLQAFIMDGTIRSILTQQERGLDLGDALSQRKIVIANVELYRPLRSDDVRLLLRLFVNDLLAHVFARPKSERGPVFVIADEVHMLATEDLAVALELGRELGFHCILAHQYAGQLRQEDGNDRIVSSVLNCARTKILFGGQSVADLEPMIREVCLEEYDPWTIKDELTSLEVEPVDKWTLQTAETESMTSSTGRTVGSSTTNEEGDSHSWSYQDGIAHSEGETESSGTAVGTQTVSGIGETILPSGEIIPSTNQLTGGGQQTFSGRAKSRSRTVSRITGASEGLSSSEAHGTSESTNEQDSKGRSVTRTWVPMTHHIKRRVVSSRTFLTEQEFLTLKLQKAKGLPQACFALKVPGHRTHFLRGPYVSTPIVGEARRRIRMDEVQLNYATHDEIAAEEQQREQRLLALAEPMIVTSKAGKPRKAPTGRGRREK